MKDNTMRPSDWPNMSPEDPVKQLFDRVLKRYPQDVSADGATSITHQWIPHVDIQEETQRFILYIDAPGIDPSAVRVYMDQGTLVIKGERKTESQQNPPSFLRIERPHGAFDRRFVLPASADPHAVTVTGRAGILYVIIRKHSEGVARETWTAKTDKIVPGVTSFTHRDTWHNSVLSQKAFSGLSIIPMLSGITIYKQCRYFKADPDQSRGRTGVMHRQAHPLAKGSFQ